MRISTNLFREIGVNSVLDQQFELSKIQRQVATGKRVVTPSDDPVASALILNFKQELEITERFQANIDAAESRISLQEQALSGAYTTLQRVRDLLVQAGNGAYTDREKAAIGLEIGARLDEIIGIANSQFAGTEYIFSGNKTNVKPFSRDPSTASGFRYDGDQGQRKFQISASIEVIAADSGYEVFQRIKNGNGSFRTGDNGNTITLTANTGTGVINAGTVTNPALFNANPTDVYSINFSVNALGQTTYDVVNVTTATTVVAAAAYVSDSDIAFNGRAVRVDGAPANGDTFRLTPSTEQDLFSTLQQAVDTLNTAAPTADARARQNIAIGRALTELDQAMTHLDVVSGAVGTRLNVTESEKLANADFLLTTKTTLSRLEDLDMVEAISKLQQQKLSLEVAQQSFAQVSNLSLFNFLR